MAHIAKCLEKLGYHSLTDMQKKVFKIITSTNRSVIIVAPTGSGKTEAALFPIMYLINKNNLKPITTIYITPLRALNRDIERRVREIAKCFNVKVMLRHGDTPYRVRRMIEKEPPHILITTPETLNYIVVNNVLKRYLDNLEFIVIDEFKELYESKRGLLLFTVIYLLEKLVLRKRIRKIALTATLKKDNEAGRIVEGKYYSGETVVIRDERVKRLEISVVRTKDLYSGEKRVGLDIDPRLYSRLLYIYDVLRRYKGVLIFTNTRSLAERLGYLLNRLSTEMEREIIIGVHHGSLSRSHRIDVEEGFKKGRVKGLIATSSMELGIDIGRIDYVIQYMSPRQATRLLQRIGRSGHWLDRVSRGSIVVNDNMFQLLESIVLTRRALSYNIEEERTYMSPLDVLAYSIAVLALSKEDGVNLYELYNVLLENPLYSNLDYEQYQRLLEYLEYSRIIRIKGHYIYSTKRTRLYVYKTSMIPDTRDIPVIDISTDRKVGVLNEEYVVLNLNEDDIIVLGGKTWKIIGYDPGDGKLYVEAVENVSETIIPHWEGENIPVEYKVAREVGSIIRRLKHGERIVSYEKILENNLEEIVPNPQLFGDDRTIIIDYCSELNAFIVNIYGGTRVNRFLRDLFRTLINAKYPFLEIHTYSIPYAVIIKPAKMVSREYVSILMDYIEEILRELKKYVDKNLLWNIVSKQTVLYWRIYQVAQRFGAIDPARHRVTRSILEGFADSIIGYEAFKEVLYRDYDLDAVEEIADLINKNYYRIVKRFSEKINTYHKEILEYIEIPYTGFTKVFDQREYRERLLSRRISLVCMKCGHVFSGYLKDFIERKEYRCPKCGAKVIAPVKGDAVFEREVVLKNRYGKRLSREEYKILEDLRKRALLLMQYGELALLVLSSRGVGVSEAVRIIGRVIQGEDLYHLLYEAEKRFVKVKKYIRRGKTM